MDATTPVSTRRQAACQDLLAKVRALHASKGATPAVLKKSRDLLVALAGQTDLFPMSDFAMPDAQGRNHMLDDAANDGFGLYLTIAMPGKEAAPHDHGIWCVNAAISGAELQRFYRLTNKKTAAEGHARIKETSRIILEPGIGMVMADHDIHSTDVLGDVPYVGLAMYGYAISRFPAVVWYHTEFDHVRACASRRPAAIAAQ